MQLINQLNEIELILTALVEIRATKACCLNILDTVPIELPSFLRGLSLYTIHFHYPYGLWISLLEPERNNVISVD